MIDFIEDGEEDAKAAVSEDKLVLISTAAVKLTVIDTEIARLTLQLDSINKDREQIVSRVLPDLMAECQMESFRLEGGASVVVKEFINLSIPSEAAIEKAYGDERQDLIGRRKECFAWMREHGHDDIIKSEVDVIFPKGKDHLCGLIIEAVNAVDKAQDIGLSVAQSYGVHAATLKKWANELKADGELGTLPQEAFSLFVGKRASIEYPKQKKARK